VVFSFRRAFPAVTFCASNVAFTPVAFTPVAFLEVVVVPFVVDGIMVFPIIVLLVGTKPLEDDGDDELLVLLCCADANKELLIFTNANANTTAIERVVTTIHMIDCFLESML
jgi:hypothetical protein